MGKGVCGPCLRVEDSVRGDCAGSENVSRSWEES